jgi:hypothetical protein
VLGVPDRVFEQASQTRLRELAGLTPGSIADAARSLLGTGLGEARSVVTSAPVG